MNELSEITRIHYEAAISDREKLLADISKVVDSLGQPITSAKLARLDQFHFGGLMATADVPKRAGINADMTVLDAGSGLGGPGRFLAETFGCTVKGIDLSPDYVAISELLTERAGLRSKFSSEAGDLTALPDADAFFDMVWTQHVVMNIRNRFGVYSELRRVLKPKGRFVFYDMLAADGHPPLHYPVPWAAVEKNSMLLTESETRDVLKACGFNIINMVDYKEQGMIWAQAQQQAAPPDAPNPFLIVGERMREMAKNIGRNLMEGRTRVMMGLCERG